jgi:hypothetical protein
MADIEQLQGIIDDLRRLRTSCEPKSKPEPRYLRYSTAVSNLLWILSDLQAEEPRATEPTERMQSVGEAQWTGS